MRGEDRSGKLPGLQALRGIAVLCVFVFHMVWYAGMIADPPDQTIETLGIAGVGVFSFFGLSGHLITSKTGDPLLKFLMDRARRIYPAFWGAILVGLGVIAALRGSSDLSIFTVFLLPSGKAENISLPYWSLIFEVQFYFIALLVAAVARGYAGFVYAAWAAAILALYHHPIVFMESAYPANWRVLLFSIYNLYFIAGFFAGARLRPERERAWPYGLAAFLILEGPPVLNATIATELMRPLYEYDFGYISSAFGVFFAVRAALLWNPGRWAARLLIGFGDASYGIYLVHMPIALLTVTVLKAWGWHFTYGTAFAFMLVWVMAPSYLYGLLDVWSQGILKSWQYKALSQASQHRTAPQA